MAEVQSNAFSGISSFIRLVQLFVRMVTFYEEMAPASLKPSGSIIAAGSIEGSDVEKDLDGGVSMWTPLGSKTSRGSRFLVYSISDWVLDDNHQFDSLCR